MCSLQGSIYFKRNTEETLHKEQAHRCKLFGIGHAMWTKPRQQHTKWIVFGELLIVCLWCVFLAIHCKMFHSFVNKMFLFGLNVFVYFWKKRELWGWQNIRSHHSWELTILLIHFSVKLCVADRRTSANRENYHLLYIECKWLHTITTHSYIFYFCLFIYSFIHFVYCFVESFPPALFLFSISISSCPFPWLTTTSINWCHRIVNSRQCRNCHLAYADNVCCSNNNLWFHHPHILVFICPKGFFFDSLYVCVSHRIYLPFIIIITYWNFSSHAIFQLLLSLCLTTSVPHCASLSPFLRPKCIQHNTPLTSYFYTVIYFGSSTNIFDDCQTRTFIVNNSIWAFFGGETNGQKNIRQKTICLWNSKICHCLAIFICCVFNGCLFSHREFSLLRQQFSIVFQKNIYSKNTPHSAYEMVMYREKNAMSKILHFIYFLSHVRRKKSFNLVNILQDFHFFFIKIDGFFSFFPVWLDRNDFNSIKYPLSDTITCHMNFTGCPIYHI